MVYRKSNFSVFIKAIDSVKAKEKAEETRLHVQRLADMQQYVDRSKEKINLLVETINPLLSKGVVVYIELLEVVDEIEKTLNKLGIETLKITGKSTQKQRKEVSDTFMASPENKVVLFSAAGGESIDLNATSELVLYNIPKGPKNFSQIIGRICRGFGAYTKFNIHEIIIEDTLDEYKQILLSSKREMEQTILNADTIPMKHNVGSFDAQLLKRIKKVMLWKMGKMKRKPKLT